LYAYLTTTYTKEGVIVPPPPTTTSLKTVATVASLSPDEDLAASSASEVTFYGTFFMASYNKRPFINDFT
jgi:hypothetical protein